MKKLIPIAVLIVAIIGSVMYWYAHRELPEFNLVSDNSNYRVELAESFNPRAKVIERQIAEGPAALVKAKLAALNAGIDLDAPLPLNVPPNEDAAPLYKRWNAMVHTKSGVAPYMESLSLQFRYTPEMLAAVHKIDDDKSKAVLYEAISKPYCTPLDVWPILRAATREVCTESTLLALAGRSSDAVATEAKCFKIQRDSKCVRGFLPFMTELTINAMATVGFGKILCHAQPNAALSGQVTAYVLENPEKVTFRRSLLSIVSDLLPLIAGVKASNLHDVKSSDQDKLFWDDLVDAGNARSLYIYAVAAKASDEAPPFRRRDLIKIAQTYSSETMARANNTFDTNFGDDPIAAFTCPVDSVALQEDHIDKLTADRNELLAGAAVLAVKAETGSYPHRLPGNFVDPFSEKSLLYKLRTNGFVIYSVGPTGTFTGDTNTGTGWDTEFSYPAPPPTPVPAALLQSP
jgi:hypothetical protein